MVTIIKVWVPVVAGFLSFILCLPIFAAEPTAPAAETKLQGIAVFDLEPINGVSADLAKLLTESLLTRLNKSRYFESVVGGSDIRAMLDMEQQKQVLGCGNEQCLAELGGALGVPLMMNPTLGLVGGRFVLNLKVIAVEEAKAKARAEGVFDNEGDLLSGLPKVVDELLAEMGGKHPSVAEPGLKRNGPLKWIGIGSTLTGVVAAAYGFSQAQEAYEAQLRAPTDFERDRHEKDGDSAQAVGLVGSAVLVGGLVVWGLSLIM